MDVRLVLSPRETDEFQRVNGFVRIRNVFGFPMERIALIASNGPVLRVLNHNLDFGVCGIGASRTLHLYIENIGLSPATFTISPDTEGSGTVIRKSDQETADIVRFQIVPRRAVLKSGEVKPLDAVFYPQEKGRCMEKFLVRCGNIEEHKVLLEGVCGEVLKLIDDTVNFGMCSLGICVDEVVRLKNNDRLRELPVQFKFP
eukprot:52353_1